MEDRERRTAEAAGSTGGVLGIAELAALGWTEAEVRTRLRRRVWRRLLPRTVLVDADFRPTAWAELPFTTRAAAALAMLGPGSALAGPSAGRLHGLAGLPPDDGVIHARLPRGRERDQQAGVRLHTGLLEPSELTTAGGFAATSLSRTVADLVLTLPRTEAVCVLDSALHQGLVVPADLPLIRLSARGRRGAARSAGIWGLGDARSESPLETRVRLLAVDCGLPPDCLQFPVRDAGGQLLGRADMVWHLRGGRLLVAEADGAEPHERPTALFRDRRRQNDFVATGRITLVRFTWADTMRPAYVTSVLRRHLRDRTPTFPDDLDGAVVRHGVS